MTIRALFSSLLLALAGSPALAQGLPDLGDASSATLSDQQERTIGNRIMREVRIDKDYIDDPEIADYASALGARLLAVADPPRREIDYFVVQDEVVNAFALVGGHIGVNGGLILLTQTESELAGVLAHETAHILQRHQARMMHGQSRSQWTSLAALALAILASRSGGSQGGQVTEAAVAAAGALQIQNQLDYTREHEREADRVGLTFSSARGFDARGMQTLFERMLRANRLNELKGAPSYLRTHPLTTERIAEIQDRLDRIPAKMVADSFEYRLVRSKLRAANGSATEAVTLFRTLLADKTIIRPREDVYGLALALRRARDFDEAWKTLAPLRSGATPHPAFELLAAQLMTDMRRDEEALAIYRAALRAFPQQRSLVYAYLEMLLQSGRSREALADLGRIGRRIVADDPRLYDLRWRAPSRRRDAPSHSTARKPSPTIAAATRGSGRPSFRDRGEASGGEGLLTSCRAPSHACGELRAFLENERAAEKALKIS